MSKDTHCVQTTRNGWFGVFWSTDIFDVMFGIVLFQTPLDMTKFRITYDDKVFEEELDRGAYIIELLKNGRDQSFNIVFGVDDDRVRSIQKLTKYAKPTISSGLNTMSIFRHSYAIRIFLRVS